MAVFLKAMALRNYCGIGEEFQWMPRFTKFNFFIGPNNSGKSTILNFVSRHLWNGRDANRRQVDELERHGGGSNPVEVAYGFEPSEIMARLRRSGTAKIDEPYQSQISKILHAICQKERLIWVSGTVPNDGEFNFYPQLDNSKVLGALQHHEWQRLWTYLTAYTGGGTEAWVRDVLNLIRSAAVISVPDAHIIPAIRHVGGAGVDFGDYSGQGLIDKLAAIQSPDHNERYLRIVFDKINAFVRTVTGNSDASIEIPHNRAHIIVHMNGRVLPLSSLGTGIEEVIMIAAFCTISDKHIICIEEPELHLHPILQRKLIAYLEENTDNQYFIATHSSVFIDTPGAAVFHVKLDDNKTVINEAILKSERFAICVDLGHRASDILQANFIIWVEGPSDRIYLNHWLRAVNENLREGIHYSIMFYGGRLLSHLSADDGEVDEFIGLRALNRNLAIVIDSDKSSPRAIINDTKKRIQRELGRGGMIWITSGREVENYIEYSVLQAAVKKVHPLNYGEPAGSADRFGQSLNYKRASRKSKKLAKDDLVKDVDKVKVARELCRLAADLGILDLRTRVTELAKRISDANAI